MIGKKYVCIFYTVYSVYYCILHKSVQFNVHLLKMSSPHPKNSGTKKFGKKLRYHLILSTPQPYQPMIQGFCSTVEQKPIFGTSNFLVKFPVCFEYLHFGHHVFDDFFCSPFFSAFCVSAGMSSCVAVGAKSSPICCCCSPAELRNHRSNDSTHQLIMGHLPTVIHVTTIIAVVTYTKRTATHSRIKRI